MFNNPVTRSSWAGSRARPFMRRPWLRIVASAVLLAGPVGCGSVGQGVSLLPDRYPLGDQARAARICLPQNLPRELNKSTIEAYRVEPGDGLLVVPHDLDTKIRLPADQTILASALPTIATRLGGFAYVSWVVVAYLLAATIAAPLYGHLGDRFGRKRMLLVALAVFTVASAACAAAPTLAALIGARALQGLGGGGLMTLAQALIGENIPPRERGRFQGYFAGVFALASTSGPILGAYLTEHISWRSVFAINLPLGVLAAFLAWKIPAVAPPRHGRYRPDVFGTILFGAKELGAHWGRIARA